LTTRDDGPWRRVDQFFRRLLGRRGEAQRARPAGSQRGTPAQRSRPQWVLLESVHSAALGSLHQQVLGREGIPVLVREWGGGSAVLGGVPVGVSLLVPENRLGEALATLGLDEALNAAMEGREHEG
jgi:hypothetical protein